MSGSCNTVLLFGVLEVVVHGAFIKGPHSKSSSLQSPKTRRTRREVFCTSYLWGSCPSKQLTSASIFMKMLTEFEGAAHILRDGVSAEKKRRNFLLV